ncbi:hypothetical protein C8R44DRAFT_874493 [Mycena epipterygia]|nr:hypothetical protein C8R44DRAFT_874493 [Mycena epipterygia]
MHNESGYIRAAADARPEWTVIASISAFACLRVTTTAEYKPTMSLDNLAQRRDITDMSETAFWVAAQKIADVQILKAQFLRDVPYNEHVLRERIWMAWVMAARVRAHNSGKGATSGQLQQHSGASQARAPTGPVFRMRTKTNFVRDRYKGWEVKLLAGMYKGYAATVGSCHPDTQILHVRVEGRWTVNPWTSVQLEHAKCLHTGLLLTEAVRTPLPVLRAIRADRDAAKEKRERRCLPEPVVGPVMEEWPEVATSALPPSEPETSLTSLKHTMALLAPCPQPTPTRGKAHWLHQANLSGRRLDIIIRGSAYKGGHYDNKVGCIARLPPQNQIKTGSRGVVRVWLGPPQALQEIPINVDHIFPLMTTEIDGLIPSHRARRVMDVVGVKVVVIGPDSLGGTQFVGNQGWIDRRGVCIGTNIFQFPEGSLCRSQEDARFLLEAGLGLE